MIWKRLFFVSASLTALCVTATIFLHFNETKSSNDDVAFKLTGITSNDVLRALVELGHLEAIPSHSQGNPARRAIEDAEHYFGLIADGVPDETLLEHLVVSIETEQDKTASTDGWGLEDAYFLVSIIFGLVTIVFKLMTIFRGTATA